MNTINSVLSNSNNIYKNNKTTFVSIFFLILITFSYKINFLYNILLLKYLYYFLNAVIGMYLIVKYYKATFRVLDKNYRLILILTLTWVILSSFNNGVLSIAMAFLSVINIITWGVILPYFFLSYSSVFLFLKKVLLYFLFLSGFISLILPSLGFSNGRMTGVFVAVAPFTNFLIISAVFLFPWVRQTKKWVPLLLSLFFQLLTQTRSSIMTTVTAMIFSFYALKKKKLLSIYTICLALLIALFSVLMIALVTEKPILDSLSSVRDSASVYNVNLDNVLMQNIRSFMPDFIGDALDDRIFHWALGVEKIFDDPFFGRGLGGMFQSNNESANSVTGYHHSLQAHNLFIEAGVNFGLPLVLLTFFIYLLVIKKIFFVFKHVEVKEPLIISSATFSLVCIILAGVGIEWFMPSHFLNKFWWLSAGILHTNQN